MKNDGQSNTKNEIHKILNRSSPPTVKEQKFIDAYLEQISAEEKRQERLKKILNDEISTEHCLRKRNRIKAKHNELSDYKNKTGNKDKVRHPHKFKRMRAFLLLIF